MPRIFRLILKVILSGSRAPHETGKYLEDDKQYFGKVDVDDEIHVFLDQKIFNSADEPIAVVGIGIPEEKFSGIVSNNYKYVLGLFFLCLWAMLILGQLLAEKISCPIVHVTDLTRDYYEKNFGNKAITYGKNGWTKVLCCRRCLKSLQLS